jgi:hypothetical protein
MVPSLETRRTRLFPVSAMKSAPGTGVAEFQGVELLRL